MLICVSISRADAGEIYIAVNMLSGPLHSEHALVSLEAVTVQVQNPDGATAKLDCMAYVRGQSVACETALEGAMVVAGEYQIRARFGVKVLPETAGQDFTPPDISQGVPYSIRILFTDRRNQEKVLLGRAKPSDHFTILKRFITR